MALARCAPLVACLALGACATFDPPDRGPERPPDGLDQVQEPVPSDEPRSEYGNPESYEVFGETYYVKDSAKGYRETGVASWYGKKFHGELTSTRERYDMYALTAAHTTLPLPTYARVTNLENDRSVVVRINDRGPFAENRIIDLSYAAAYRLDMIEQGTARVEVEALTPENRQTPEVSGEVAVQAGAFSEEDNAHRLRRELEAAGLEPVTVETDPSGSPHRVRLGPVAAGVALEMLLDRLQELGIDNPQIIRDS